MRQKIYVCLYTERNCDNNFCFLCRKTDSYKILVEIIIEIVKFHDIFTILIINVKISTAILIISQFFHLKIIKTAIHFFQRITLRWLFNFTQDCQILKLEFKSQYWCSFIPTVNSTLYQTRGGQQTVFTNTISSTVILHSVL